MQARAFGNMGKALQHSKRLEKAIECYQKQLHYGKLGNDKTSMAAALDAIGTLSLRLVTCVEPNVVLQVKIIISWPSTVP